MPRARGQENEGDEYGHPRDPLRDGLLVERIHRCMNGTPAVPPRNARPKCDPNSERTSFNSVDEIPGLSPPGVGLFSANSGAFGRFMTDRYRETCHKHRSRKMPALLHIRQPLTLLL